MINLTKYFAASGLVTLLAMGSVPAQEAMPEQTPIGPPPAIDMAGDLTEEWTNPDRVVVPNEGTQSIVSLGEIEIYMQSLKQIQAQFILIGPDFRTSHGTFSLAKPGRLRFEYDPPDHLLIVSDGKVISLVDYDLRQVTRWPIKKTPLRPLVRSGAVFGEDVTVGRIVQQANSVRVSIAEAGDEDDGTMELVFSTDPLRLEGWEIIDSRGKRTIIVLDQLKTNVELADSLWSFDDPRPKRRRLPGK